MKKAICLLMFVLMICSANALVIKDFDAEVDNHKDKSVTADGGVIDEVKPESEIIVMIELYNNDSYEIEDVEINGIIYDIDDGDDLEDEKFIGDLSSGKDDDAELRFDVPLEIEEDDYLMEIKIEYEYNNTEYEEILNFTVRVEKERHDIRILRAELNNDLFECTRDGSLNVRVINLGRKDEEDVKIKVVNLLLGVDLFESDIELEEGTDDDNSFTADFDLFLEHASAGDYTLDVSVLYDDGDKADSEEVYLTVADCVKGKESAEEDDDEDEEEVVVLVDDDGEKAAAEKKKDEPKELVILGAAFVVLLFTVVLVAGVMIKRL